MDSIDERINLLLIEGKKLEAIKLCKDSFNIDFKDAKTYVEELVSLSKLDGKNQIKPVKEPKMPREPLADNTNNINQGQSITPPVSIEKINSGKRMFRDMEAFTGRIRRTEYALSLMLAIVASVTLGAFVLANYENDEKVSGWIPFLYLCLCSAMWSQGARRCHDLGNSGWM